MLLSTIATFGFFDEVALLTQLPNVFTILLGKKNRKQSIVLLEQRVLSRVFWVFNTNVSIFLVISFNAFWKFLLWLGNSAWDFLEVNFGPGIFLGFDFAPIRSSLSLEIRSSLAWVSGVSGEKGKDGSEKGRENLLSPRVHRPLGLSSAEKLYKDAEFFTLSIPS